MRRAPRQTKALLALVLAVSALGLARPSRAAIASARATEPELLSSSAGGASFVIEVPEPHFTSVTAPNGTWQRMELENWTWDAMPGQPLVPTRSVMLAVPEGARVTIDAVGEEARVYEGMRLLPQQALSRSSADPNGVSSSISPGREIASRIWEDPAVYRRVGEGPSPAATLDGVTHLRAQRVARVTVRPVAYDPSTGRVRVWSRVRVSLSFEGGRANAGTLDALGGGTAPLEESGPFERIYRNAILNYESGRAWRVDLAANSVRRRGLGPDAAGGAGAGAGTLGGAREDFTASPNWVRLELTTKGVYRLTPSDFATVGVNASSIDPRTLRVFVRPGTPVVDELETPGAWLTEVAVNVAGESDGTFDSGDYLMFVGLGSSGWKDDYRSPGSDSLWFTHPYDTKNVYWVTWGGGFSGSPKRWTTRSVAPELVGAYDAPDFPGRAHVERDLDYRPDLQEGGPFFFLAGAAWEKWVWQVVTDRSGTVPFTFTVPGPDLTKPARLFARTWGNSHESIGNPFLPDHHVTLTVNDVAMPERVFYGLVRQDWDTLFTLRPTNNRVTLACRFVTDSLNAGRQDQMAMMWFDVFYRRRFTPVSDVLDFRSADTTGAVGYGIGPFVQAAGLMLLDTSDPLATVQLTGMVVRDTTGGSALYFHDDAASPKHYLALSSTGIRRPDLITKPAIDDLKSPTNGADYVVLTYDGYIQPATTLANYRASHLPGFPSARTRVVKISDVYNWYSGGRTDPVAIRNFFYDAIKNVGWSPAPSYVCLLGDASYDFKNLYRLAPAGQPAVLVPSYPNGWQSRQFMMDDWLVDLDLGVSEPYPGGPPPGYGDSVYYDVPDIVVGRIPASTLNEARFLVEQKILPYEQTPSFGDWRTRALFVADDTTQFNGSPDARDPVYLDHMEETERLAGVYLAPVMQTRKIFELKYPFGAGTEKPLVNADVKAAVNGGVALWNYIGHGNPFKMADENAFILSDVGALSNTATPTLLIAASCDLGKFDDAVITGLGEALFKWRSGGAIATISATDIAFAFSNIELAKALYTTLCEEDATGFVNSMGEALFLAKYRRTQLSVNDNKYVLLGDPAQRLGLPRDQVRLALTRAGDGVPIDSLRRGEQVHVQGEVHTSHDPGVDALDATFNGTVNLLITDAPPRDSVLNIGRNLPYTTDPSALFRGSATVTNGRFDASFFVPLEALLGPNAKVFAYANNSAYDGGGVEIRSVVGGTPSYVDTVGPTITMAFASGDTRVGPTETLRIVVRDESGVNITGHTIPNALFLTIDGTSRYDLTKGFRYDIGSSQQGSVDFALPGLDAGPHGITVSAADNFAAGVLARRNRTTASIDFDVLASDEFTLGRVFNFPNPFRTSGGTSFVLTGLSEPADVVVSVFTVSGSLVRRLDASGGPGQVQLAWDGLDSRGDRLANGAYLYQVEAQGRTSGRLVRFNGRAALVE